MKIIQTLKRKNRENKEMQNQFKRNGFLKYLIKNTYLLDGALNVNGLKADKT